MMRHPMFECPPLTVLLAVSLVNPAKPKQLREFGGIDKVVLAGMSANLCIESHLRELLEQGFEVAVVADATAAAKHPELGDGYAAALTNFRYIAGAVLTTEQAVKALGADRDTLAGPAR